MSSRRGTSIGPFEAFLWYTPEHGFKWDSVNRLVPAKNPDSICEYYPLKRDLALHRKFAALGKSEEEILGFANDFGLLLDAYAPEFRPTESPENFPKENILKEERVSRLARFDSRTGSHFLGGEPKDFWIDEIHDMEDAIWLWDKLGRNDGEPDVGALKGTIRWVNEEVYFLPKSLQKESWSRNRHSRYWYFQTNLKAHIARKFWEDSYLKPWRKDFDVIGPAQQWLMLTVNKKLRNHASPQLQLYANADARLDLKPTFRPHNLLGAMWLHLYMDVIGAILFRECLVCGTWFVCKKKDRIYCKTRGTGCRKKALRIRDKVRKAGKSIREVAKEEGRPIDIIRQIVESS